ncbi:hypothetical protein S40285_07051 [Stachybotrys chlorohalonatus IBT 40285]|uniref:AB hydrolase-1 domain-containing protein n=1 Tax=Stachybotrys chlorohalonatus (strain IBT 40285) TaxID=1283841 RepID=A0A084QX54_STAC4|nr:hypothetical protein S40285_07051 [Stachybotrys chlorohalonata IBT 40285]
MYTEKPLLGIVHGAWHDPTFYIHLNKALRLQGFSVLTPRNETVGLDNSVASKTHIDDVRVIHQELLPHLDVGRRAVIVCHSYGGVTGTCAMKFHSIEERAARGLSGGIIAILYLSALVVPERGLSVFTFCGSTWPTWQREEVRFEQDVRHRHTLIAYNQSGLRVLKSEAADVLFTGIPSFERHLLYNRLLGQSDASFTTEIDYTPEESMVKKVYIICLRDEAISKEEQDYMAVAINATRVQMECGHSPFLESTKIEELARLIESVVP